MTSWPAAIATAGLAATLFAAAWFTWQARRITAAKYWINGQPVSRRTFEARTRSKDSS